MDTQILAFFTDKIVADDAVKKLKERYPILAAQVVNRTENELSSEAPPSVKITKPIYTGEFPPVFPEIRLPYLEKLPCCDVCAEIYTQEGYEEKAAEYLKECGAYDVTIS